MKKIFKSFWFAFNGLRLCFISELNFRIHLLVAGFTLIFALLFSVSVYEWIVIGLCIAFVIVAEMFNTAIEKFCDIVHKDIHPVIKKIKDISAGAVLVAALFSSIAGLCIFVPKIILFIKSV